MKHPFSLSGALSGKTVLYSFSIIIFTSFCAAKTQAQEQSSVTITQAGKTIYNDGDKERVISENANDVILPTPYNNLIFYIEGRPAEVSHFDNRIMSFNIHSGKKKEIVGQGAKADMGYKVQGEIAAICLDKIANRLYFSTVNAGGKIKEYLTWYYDLMSGDVKIFKDGRVTTADQFGNITVVMNGVDPKGAYTQTATYASNGNMVTMKDRQY